MDICQAHDLYNTAHQEILVNFYKVGCYLKAKRQVLELGTFWVAIPTPSIVPPRDNNLQEKNTNEKEKEKERKRK